MGQNWFVRMAIPRANGEGKKTKGFASHAPTRGKGGPGGGWADDLYEGGRGSSGERGISKGGEPGCVVVHTSVVHVGADRCRAF